MGLRLGEVLNLTVGDIDGERSRVHIRCAKGRQDRFVTLPDATLVALLRLVQWVLGVWNRIVPEPTRRPAFPCRHCGRPLQVVGFRPPGWQSG